MEVEEALRDDDGKEPQAGDGDDGDDDDALLKECGDVLWNAMLLCHVAGRGRVDTGDSSIDAMAGMAAEKIRRRTPYMEWAEEEKELNTGRGGAGAARVASRVEAEAAWNAAKGAEQQP